METKGILSVTISWVTFFLFNLTYNPMNSEKRCKIFMEIERLNYKYLNKKRNAVQSSWLCFRVIFRGRKATKSIKMSPSFKLLNVDLFTLLFHDLTCSGLSSLKNKLTFWFSSVCYWFVYSKNKNNVDEWFPLILSKIN